MSMYMEMADVLAQKNLIDIDKELQTTKAQKNLAMSQFDERIGKLNEAKTISNMEKAQIQAQKKTNKLQKDLMKNMIDNQGLQASPAGVPVVDQFAGTQIEPEAQGLPIINQMA